MGYPISSKLLKEWADRGTSEWFEFDESEPVRMCSDWAGLKMMAELSE
jgi:hypothetical protein